MTEKQRQFVAEYRVDGNARAAAIRAGYSRKYAASCACRLMKDPQVLAALHCGEDADMGQQVLRELRSIAFGGGSDTGKLRALELLGKILGLFDSGGKQLPPVTIVDDL